VSGQSSLQINLSYVLHEPSDSRAVHRAARASNRFDRNRRSMLQQFQSLSDAALRERLVIAPTLDGDTATIDADTLILSAQVGLPELVPDVLRACNPVEEGAQPPIPLLADGAFSPPECMYVQLFRAPAFLVNPAEFASPGPLYVLAVVRRPGGGSLQLVGEGVDSPFDIDDHGQPGWGRSVIRALERVIQAYVDQWTPVRPLWDRPAEVELPEYASRDEVRSG
jgi:hypothetical protein